MLILVRILAINGSEMKYVKLKFVLLLTMVLHSLSTTKAQSYMPHKIDDSSIDNSIRHGILPNGFTYYIKSMDKPQAKTYLRFSVKAGYECEEILYSMPIQPTKNHWKPDCYGLGISPLV